MHGFGKYIWKDNKQYEGQYVDDKKHGYGIYTWPDGRIYKGYWKDGKQHGLAEYQLKASSGLQIRYGLWEGGARIKWFKINKEEDTQKQLKDIEEQYIKELE